MFGKNRYKTARCILRCEGSVLLAVHSSFWSKPNRRWGLPGGGIEWRETPINAARRELREELELHLDDLVEIGPYTYKGHQHMVFGADIPHQIKNYDDTELLDTAWYSVPEIEKLATDGKLHAGYELEATQRFFENN